MEAYDTSQGTGFTAAGLADDMQKGIMDRFRSLPMSRSAVVFGRTASDLVLTAISLLVMGVAGLAVGWRVPNGFDGALAGFGLLMLYAYALSGVMAYVGLLVRSVEVVNNAALIVIFPLTFAANTLVPEESPPAGYDRSQNGTLSRRSPKPHASCSATSHPERRSRQRGRSSSRSSTPSRGWWRS